MTEQNKAPPTKQQRLYDALKRITKYMTPDQIRRDTKNVGLDYEEYLEMSYENIQQEAKHAIRGMRRPVAAILVAVATLTLAGCGDGAFQRLTTLAGVYEVEHPGGYPVVCFVEASHGGVFCMTDKELREGT